MILVDFSQVIIAPVMYHHQKTKQQLSEDLIRHIVISNILNIRNKLSKYSKDVVLCFDGQGYWRNEEFPYYKQSRKKRRDQSTFDWGSFYGTLNKLKDEFSTYLPFKCIEVKRAEADDVIAVLARTFYDEHDNIIIVSVDKDFFQLQEFVGKKIRQWSPMERKFITKVDYDYFTHIVKGDSSDGIPNVFSDDDVFVTDKRSKPVQKKLLEKLRVLDRDDLKLELGEAFTKFERNEKLINLLRTPSDIREEIVSAYNKKQPKKSLMTYLVKFRLRKILEQNNL